MMICASYFGIIILKLEFTGGVQPKIVEKAMGQEARGKERIFKVF